MWQKINYIKLKIKMEFNLRFLKSEIFIYIFRNITKKTILHKYLRKRIPNQIETPIK